MFSSHKGSLSSLKQKLPSEGATCRSCKRGVSRTTSDFTLRLLRRWSLRMPVPALDCIKTYLVAANYEVSLETLAKPLGQANRPPIQWRDQTDDSRPTERLEGDAESG